MMTFVSSTCHFDSHTTWSLRTKFLCLPTAPRFEQFSFKSTDVVDLKSSMSMSVQCPGTSRFDHRGDGSLILKCKSMDFVSLFAFMLFWTCIYSFTSSSVLWSTASKLVKEAILIFLVRPLHYQAVPEVFWCLIASSPTLWGLSLTP